jgi:hypothetical protein
MQKNSAILANAKYGDLRQQKIRRSSPMQKIRRSSLMQKNGYLPRQKVWAAHFKRMN